MFELILILIIGVLIFYYVDLSKQRDKSYKAFLAERHRADKLAVKYYKTK